MSLVAQGAQLERGIAPVYQLTFQCEIFIILSAFSKLCPLSSQAPFVFWPVLLHSCLGSDPMPRGNLKRVVLNAI